MALFGGNSMSELVAMSADMFVRRRCFHTLCVATSGISQSRTRSARKGFLHGRRRAC